MLARKDNHLVQRPIVIPSRCSTSASFKYNFSEQLNVRSDMRGRVQVTALDATGASTNIILQYIRS